MMGTAAIVDFFQFLLNMLLIGIILNRFISILTLLTFYIWFKMHNVSFSNSPKRFGVMAITGLTEIIPLLDLLPAWTISTGVTIGIVRREDAVYNQTQGRIQRSQVRQQDRELEKVARQVSAQTA